jgi:hypothetical protein
MSFAYEAQKRSVGKYPSGSIKRLENGENIEPFPPHFVEQMQKGIISQAKIQEGIDRVAEAERKNAPRLLAEIEEVRKRRLISGY